MDTHELHDPLFNLAAEIISDPVPLIGMCGLDTVHNATHRIIWDTLTVNRTADRSPISYRALFADHEFPPSKIKKSYEYGTVPGGILKRNWIRKHMFEVPALVVLFVELEWDDLSFAEKRIACSSKIATIRASLVGRNVRIALVLIQSKPATFTPGEASPDTEKITSICNACELGFKQVFFLPSNENLSGYVVRLEAAFFEIAQQYYLNEAKRVRGHRDAVIRMQSSNLPLLVRHQFKIGYFNEFRQDQQTALKHYQQAYDNLKQIRQDGGFEVKSVAMIINYRICRLSFKLNCPVDAISNFKKHLETFKIYKGLAELSYQHEAWIFKQYFIFGTLFDEAVQRGLSAIPSENPGIYFCKAADHMKLRQINCRNFPPQEINFQPAPPTEGEFYGQLILSVPSSAGDMPIAVYLQSCERLVNHSVWIIHLLNLALLQFRKHRCTKTSAGVHSRLADEFLDAGQYEKALYFINQALVESRESNWSIIFSQLLLKQIRIAALMPSPPDFIQSCLEAIGEKSYLPVEERSRIQEVLQQIIAGHRPDFRELLGPQSQLAYQKWSSFSAESLRYTIDMDKLVSFLDLTCSFTEDKCFANAEASVEVSISSSAPFPIKFTELRIVMPNAAHNMSVTVDSLVDQGMNLDVVPGEPKVISLKIRPRSEDVGKALSVAKAYLRMGPFLLVWSGGRNEEHSKKAIICGQTIHLASPGTAADRSTIEIVNRPSAVELSCSFDAPVLVGETFPLQILIKSLEPVCASNCKLGIMVDDPNAVGKMVFADSVDGNFSNECHISLDDIVPGAESTAVVYLQCFSGLKAKVKVWLSYEVEESAFKCVAKAEGVIESVSPFQVRFLSKGMNGEEFATERHLISPDDPLVFFAVIKNMTPARLTFGDISLKLGEAAVDYFVPFVSYVRGLDLGQEDEAQDVFFIRITGEAKPNSSISIGPLVVKWKRTGSNLPDAASYIPVPDLVVKSVQPMLKVSLILPSKVMQCEPLELRYEIENASDQLIDATVMLSTSDEYVLAGEKAPKLRLGPRMRTNVLASMVPIHVGYMRLPMFDVQCTGDIDYRTSVELNLPKTVFVFPNNLTQE